MQDKYINLLKHDECISEAEMLKYLDGTLDPATQHRVERHLLDCELCSDAMEGLSIHRRDQLQRALKDLDERIDKRLDSVSATASPLLLFYRIAAIVLLVALSGGGLYYFRSYKRSEKIFSENYKPYSAVPSVANPVTTNTADEKPTLKGDNKSPASPGKAEQRVAPKDKHILYPKTSVPVAATGATKTRSDDMARETTPGSADAVFQKKENEPATGSHDKNTISPSSTNPQNAEAVTILDESRKLNRQSKSQPPSVGILKDNTSVKNPEEKENLSTKKTALESDHAGFSIADSSNLARTNSLMKEGIKQYEEKNYSGAIVIFNTVLKNDPGNTEALFYGGVSNLNQHEETVAVKLFESVLKHSPNTFADAARWYLSLAYIKKNKISKAKPLLEELSRSDNEYNSRAKKTLDELK